MKDKEPIDEASVETPEASTPPEQTASEASAEATEASAPQLQPASRDPLHGVTLEAMVKDLVAFFGWEELGNQVAIRCFQHDPSVASSLKFLRRTPWARAKVEGLYLFVLRERRRRGHED